MQTVELFCGTKSFSKVASQNGHETLTVDNDPQFGPDIVRDVREVEVPPVDMLWASPPCQGFSVAAIGKNWNHDYSPKHQRAVEAKELVQRTIEIIEKTQPKWWFIENPRAMLRKLPFMQEFTDRNNGVRHTITYCQYGDTRMKPTDIWTNAWWWEPRPSCKNGGSCHQSAPRGSRTGTQGLKGARDRGKIPQKLFEDIFEQLKDTNQ